MLIQLLPAALAVAAQVITLGLTLLGQGHPAKVTQAVTVLERQETLAVPAAVVVAQVVQALTVFLEQAVTVALGLVVRLVVHP